LKEAGYSDGQNLVIEDRWAEGHYDRLPALAADLVRRQVAVIAALGGTPAAFAAKAATTTIPIVFVVGVDPVHYGVVLSLNRPGGNMTGVAVLSAEVAAKRLDLLHELLPTATIIALLVNPTNSLAGPEIRGVRDAARARGLELHVLNANNEGEIDVVFGALIQYGANALVVVSDPLFNSRRDQIAALTARHGMPAAYGFREFAAALGVSVLPVFSCCFFSHVPKLEIADQLRPECFGFFYRGGGLLCRCSCRTEHDDATDDSGKRDDHRQRIKTDQAEHYGKQQQSHCDCLYPRDQCDFLAPLQGVSELFNAIFQIRNLIV